MARHLRFQSTEWAPHLITARCTQGQPLLRPSAEVNAIIAGALAKSLTQHTHEVELHHYVIMSNHLHLIISAHDAHAKSRFMCHLNGSLARELCRHWGMRDHLWEGRYHSHELLDEDALIDAYKYLFKNSVKEGLVRHPREWPGLHGYTPLCEGAVVTGRWLDRTRWGYAQRTQRGQARGEQAYMREAPVTLTRPRCWRGWSDERFKERCERWCAEAVREALEARARQLMEARRASGARALTLRAALAALTHLGAEAVCAQPLSQTHAPNRSPRPLCRSGCAQRFADFLRSYRDFVDAFKHTSWRLRDAIARGARLPQVRFPEGGVPLYIGT